MVVHLEHAGVVPEGCGAGGEGEFDHNAPPASVLNGVGTDSIALLTVQPGDAGVDEFFDSDACDHSLGNVESFEIGVEVGDRHYAVFRVTEAAEREFCYTFRGGVYFSDGLASMVNEALSHAETF